VFGKTELLTYGIAGIGVVALVTDLVWGRIFNWLTLPALLSGMAVSFHVGGLSLLGASALGVFLGLVFYGPLFAARWIGGGDVKLLMAFGAWGGPQFVTEVALLAILVGGVMAFVILVSRGKIRGFAQRMFRFFLSLFVRELEIEAPQIDHKLQMPFGIPIVIASVWISYADPFEKWGMRVWPF
jgi:prepilin peptidase CpaA